MMITPGRSLRAAVSLIELLAVLAILGLLISVVVPILSAAHRTNRRVTCMATLHQIAGGALTYALNHQQWIIGSPWGSGAYLSGEAVAFGPAVQNWDFMGPMAHQWRMAFTMGSKGTGQEDVVKRFNQLRGHPAFRCPANGFLSLRFSGPDAGVGPMVSYNTVRAQLYTAEEFPSNHAEKLPRLWRPSVTHIGNPSKKVFCADGSRYATVTQVPDYDLGVNAPFGGAFSAEAAYSTYARSWDRSRAPGNGWTGPVDARVYAYRHSTAVPQVGAPGNAYKMNVAFYDGHVETQGDLDSTNPHQWLPGGTVLETNECWPDTIEHFSLTGTLKIAN